MAPVINERVLFNEVPQGYPDPERTVVLDKSQTIDVDTVPLNGGFLVKVLVLSVDPYLRNKMRDPNVAAYNTAYQKGEPIDAYGVAVVTRSETPSVSVGDHLYGVLPFVEYVVLTDSAPYRRLDNSEKLPWSVYTGSAGMPGKTAFYGWTAYVHSHVKNGDTLFVTTGAGPVGSLVIQLAKQDGLKVIASAGSDEKVKFMKDIGADVAFNYKTTSTKEVLDKHGPINVYWDHVGGEILDLALDAAAPFSRFIEVGMISGYNEGYPAIKNIKNILFKSITMQGFVVGNLESQYNDAFYATIPQKLASGEFKYLEYKKHGLKSAGQLLLDVQKGGNVGKAVIVVAKE